MIAIKASTPLDYKLCQELTIILSCPSNECEIDSDEVHQKKSIILCQSLFEINVFVTVRVDTQAFQIYSQSLFKEIRKIEQEIGQQTKTTVPKAAAQHNKQQLR